MSRLDQAMQALRDAVAVSHARSDEQRLAEGGEVDQRGTLSKVNDLLNHVDLGYVIDAFNPGGSQMRQASGGTFPLGDFIGMGGLAREADLIGKKGLPTFHSEQPEQPFLSSDTLLNNPLENPTGTGGYAADDPDAFGEHLMNTADASQLLPLAGPVARGVRGIPRALGEGLMELGGHGTMSAAAPLTGTLSGKSLGQLMDELRGLVKPKQFKRASRMADYAPGAMSILSLDGIRDLATTPGHVAFLKPGSFADWAKPMITDNPFAIPKYGEVDEQWARELLHGQKLANLFETTGGMHVPPALTIGETPHGQLATVAHQGRHRDIAAMHLSKRDAVLQGTDESAVRTPTILYRFNPKSPLPRGMSPALKGTDPFQIHHRVLAEQGNRIPPYDWYTPSRGYEERSMFRDPGNLDLRDGEQVIPQYGKLPMDALLSSDAGPYTFPRPNTEIPSITFARGGLAAFDEVE